MWLGCDRARFLKFVLGTSRLPQKFDGKLSITVDTSKTVNHFPRARTCVFKLILPPYTTQAQLLAKLQVAVLEDTFSAEG